MIYFDILTIAIDQFCPFYYEKGRVFSFRRLLLFLVMPVALGVAIAIVAGPIQRQDVGMFIAVYGLIAAVMTSLLAVVHSIVGMSRDDKLGASQWAIKKQRGLRLEVLRELYSNISFAVLLLVGSVVPLLSLYIEMPRLVIAVISVVVYMIGAIVGTSFISIIVGVYHVLDVQAQDIHDAMKEGDPDHGDL